MHTLLITNPFTKHTHFTLKLLVVDTFGILFTCIVLFLSPGFVMIKYEYKYEYDMKIHSCTCSRAHSHVHTFSADLHTTRTHYKPYFTGTNTMSRGSLCMLRPNAYIHTHCLLQHTRGLNSACWMQRPVYSLC